MSAPSASYLNALIAKLVHMSRDVGRDWHTGQEFPLRASQDVVDAIRESAVAARLARSLLDHIATLESDREALEEAKERHNALRHLLIETVDSSLATEGAGEFISRLTEAMEAAADKFEDQS